MFLELMMRFPRFSLPAYFKTAKRIVSPDERIVFQYTTSSTSLQKKLKAA